MSNLKSLADSLDLPGVMFHEEFTAKQAMHYNIPRMVVDMSAKEETKELNASLERDIRESGDNFGGRNSSASCFMTQWDMHKHYKSFEQLGKDACAVAESGALAERTYEDGTNNPIKYYVQETWGLIYTKGHATKMHTHWPSVWSYTYCVKAELCCSPLVFPSATGGGYEIFPVTSQLIVFPSWINHSVPEHICDHERIMISGNLDVIWD
jgi:hypothetical protein